MVFTRQKAREDTNTEPPPRIHLEINIREIRTPSRTVFTQGWNKLSVQQVFEYSQDLEGEVFHYRVLCLNKSSTEDDLKKTYLKLAL